VSGYGRGGQWQQKSLSKKKKGREKGGVCGRRRATEFRVLIFGRVTSSATKAGPEAEMRETKMRKRKKELWPGGLNHTLRMRLRELPRTLFHDLQGKSGLSPVNVPPGRSQKKKDGRTGRVPMERVEPSNHSESPRDRSESYSSHERRDGPSRCGRVDLEKESGLSGGSRNRRSQKRLKES